MIQILIIIVNTLNIYANENWTITVKKWLLEIYVGFEWILGQRWGEKYYHKKSWSIWNLTEGIGEK